MSDEPIRLLDDPGTPDLLREDLEKERRAPWEHDAVAGLAALRAAIQSGGPLPDGDGPPGHPPASPPSAPVSGTGAVAAKGGVAAKGLLLGLAAVGVVTGIAVSVARWSPRPAAPESAPAILPPATTAAAGSITSAPADALPAPQLPEGREGESGPKAAPSLALQGEGATGRARTPPSSSALRDQRNAEEIAHMITVREKAAGDPAEALRLADEGQQRFAGGLFSIEREFIAISSLARLGRAADARRRGERFIAAHPSSPYADRVRAVIGDSPAP